MPKFRGREIRINGFLLPMELVEIISDGQNIVARDFSALATYVSDMDKPQLEILSLSLLTKENAAWLRQKDPMFLGAKDPLITPGDIDPQNSILFGDFGPGSDQPLALDYRASLVQPKVIILKWSPYGKNNRWVQIAENFAQFKSMIGF